MADLFDDLDDGDKVGRKEMKEEAIRRMQTLGVLDDVIEKFKQDKLQMSEFGILFDLPEDVKKIVSDYEKDYGNLVYHVIHSVANIGEMYELCFVSQYMDDWEYEREMLKHNIVYAHVENKTFPENSESGSIQVKNHHGSLYRVG